MNSLRQLPGGLYGSPEAVETLEKAGNARLLVISDTHGHYPVFESILREFGAECDALLFAGDGMWDVIQYMENAYSSEKLREALPAVVAFVAGNGDGDQYRISLPVQGDEPLPEDCPGAPVLVLPRQIVKACGYSILLVHGHRHSVEVGLDMLVDSARAMDCDIAVYGHTHVPVVENFAHILAVNPGSAARPRGQSNAGFAIIELDARSTEPKVEFIIVREKLRGGFAFDTSFLA